MTVMHGVDGVLTWTVDGKAIDVDPGQALCISQSAVIPSRIWGIRMEAACGGPPGKAKMMEIMRRHGLTRAGNDCSCTPMLQEWAGGSLHDRSLVLQLCILCFGLFQDRDVRISVFPEG